MNNNNHYSFDCLLSEFRNIQLKYINVDNTQGGSLELTFVGERKGFDNCDELIKCKFSTYIFVKAIDEYYDGSESQFVDVKNNEVSINEFGPVITFKEAPWLQYDADRKLDFNSVLPKQYHIMTMDDIIDILSIDEPVFWLPQKN